MSLHNHSLKFRPLRAGVEIFNPRLNEVGTLGCIGHDVGGGAERWLISCYHVLVGGANVVAINGEPIFQPSADPEIVASIDSTKCDPILDCAAAKLSAGIGSNAEVLGIGTPGIPMRPRIADRVIKSGATTGVTEGIIEQIIGDDILIAIMGSFDPDYDLSRPGDSGSLWLRSDGLAPVALHMREAGDPQKRVKATCILPILASLQLKLIQ
jgi:hypothetical protein